MKKPTFIVSTLAAISTVVAIGFAYAQSNTTNTEPGSSATTNSSAPSTSNRDSTGTMSNSETSNMNNERLARTDRN